MKSAPLAVGLFLCLSASPGVCDDGDAALGARAFRACAACHSLEANRNMTGPSLANIWNREAGSLSSFSRYSDAMKSSHVFWNEKTLDGYLEDPAQFMPGNHMTFQGIPDQRLARGSSPFSSSPIKRKRVALTIREPLNRRWAGCPVCSAAFPT